MKKNSIAVGFVIFDMLLFLGIILTGMRNQKLKEDRRPTVTPEPTATSTVTPTCTNTPIPEPTATNTVTPTPSPTPVPTDTPIPTPVLTRQYFMNGQTEFKSYMSYKAITDTSSDQYKLQQIAYTGDYGIRMVDGYYCVALGSRWATKIGTKMTIWLEDGTELKLILGDQKSDAHTDPTHSFGSRKGDVLEFIVDIPMIPEEVRILGSFNAIFKGKVVRFEIYLKE